MENGLLPDRWFPVRPRTLLTQVKEERMPFSWSINPYRGCGHGCHFCYARQTHTWLGFHTDDSFRNNIIVKKEAAQILREELHKGKWKGGGIAVGTVTDPYQQIEGKLKITREILRVLREYSVPISITTRSPLILRDLDLLRDMKIDSINISISTLSEEVWKQTEPSSPHPKQRLLAVKKLNEARIQAGVFLAPIMPYLTDQDEQLEAVIREAGVNKAQFLIPSVLRLKPEVKDWFFRQIHRSFPKIYPRLVRLYEGGYAPEEYVRGIREKVLRLAEEEGLPTTLRNRRMDPTKDPSKHATVEAPVQLSLF
ncbi:SPL family radical SAM protein [Marininema halotolerans]|uniref:DNA repair photolyase n=1 Tax=Marininema halotolerans TaxID=1155944 RepID=A0A1I6PY37_9BACL|nr:radical SAM protein [Marininema halotolerans]SFS44995.1 DNA repair photolyase [Marininema halotolerans]